MSKKQEKRHALTKFNGLKLLKTGDELNELLNQKINFFNYQIYLIFKLNFVNVYEVIRVEP